MPLRVAGEKKLWKGGLLGATVHMSLHTGVGATAANELTAADAPNYARIAVAPAGWTVSDRTGAASNAAAIAFAAPPANTEWPAVRSVALWTAAAAGDLLVDEYVQGAPLVGAAGDPVAFAPGQLVLDV